VGANDPKPGSPVRVLAWRGFRDAEFFRYGSVVARAFFSVPKSPRRKVLFVLGPPDVAAWRAFLSEFDGDRWVHLERLLRYDDAALVAVLGYVGRRFQFFEALNAR
jgi:hypothetical protein